MSHINGGMVTVNGVYLLQNQPAQGTGGVTFYNPAQFTQVALLQPAIVLRELLFESPPLTVFFNCISSDKCSTWRGAALGSIGWPTAVPSVEIKAILQR